MATLESAATGAIASSLANIAVYPLDLAKTLVQTEFKNEHVNKSSGNISDKKDVSKEKTELKYQNAIDCIIKVFKERGISGLYRGMSTSVLGNFIQSFFYFFWYTLARKYYFKVKSSRAKSLGQIGRIRLNTIEELIIGAAAGATTQFFTNPFSVISTKQQTAESTNENASLKSVIKQIYKEQNNDITGFWKGLKVSLVLCINPSITFASYQRLKPILFNAEELMGGRSDELSALQNFILGVLSKMISTFLTQPLIVAKASLQRAGSKFHSFQQVIYHLYENEGILALWKGIKPQLAKAVMVQGLLFMFKGELTKILHRAIFLQSNVFLRKRSVVM